MLIRGGDTKILLDVGISSVQLQKRLSKFRLSISDLDAVFLTHEHDDHSHSAHLTSRRFNIPIVANPKTLTALTRKSALARSITLDTGTSINIGELIIESFPVLHDAVDPVGYNVLHGRHKVSLVTDTGVVGGSIARSVEGADLVIIEANHDVEQLRGGPYPQSLKARVLSRVGHLSNEDAASFVMEQVEENRRLSTVWLAHLSGINNSPRMARRHVQRKLSEAKCRNVVLDVAQRSAVGPTWRAF